MIVCEGGAVGANIEHSMLDALVRKWCVIYCTAHYIIIRSNTNLKVLINSSSIAFHLTTMCLEAATPTVPCQWMQSNCQNCLVIRLSMPSAVMNTVIQLRISKL